ncbi:MAG: Diacetylchitobiose deacetylase [Candidatus Woesearchaeota archaeon]|nr:Diacetylchitobiose deacetylase [Candidatus Woesearchaeota archaeon]
MIKFFNNNTEPTQGENIEQIFPKWEKEKEKVVFVGPHDDDICLGAGLLVQAVQEFGADPYFFIVTDGREGYCSPEQEPDIYDIRVSETEKSSSIIGVKNIFRFDFPDGDLAIYNKTSNQGMIRKLTYAFKNIGATRVILPTQGDMHPDHKYANESALISVFHANGGVWDGIKTQISSVIEYAVYCPFESEPDLALWTGQKVFEKKLEAIAAYESQEQISTIVENVRSSGPVEVFRSISMQGYSPRKTFEKYFT